MNENKKFWELMKDPNNKVIFVKTLYRHILNNLKDAFGYCCRHNLTLNEYCPLERFGNYKNEATTFISVRMSELWENAIYEAVKELFGQIEIEQNEVQRWTDADGDIKIFGESWEIKTSQAENSFTGATHSTHKVKKYILINYLIDRDVKLRLQTGNLRGFIPKMSVFIMDLDNVQDTNIWIGVPKSNSSFSSMYIKNDWIRAGCLNIIWGGVNLTRFKNAKIIHQSTSSLDENITYQETSNLVKIINNLKK